MSQIYQTRAKIKLIILISPFAVDSEASELDNPHPSKAMLPIRHTIFSCGSCCCGGALAMSAHQFKDLVRGFDDFLGLRLDERYPDVSGVLRTAENRSERSPSKPGNHALKVK